MKQNVLDGVMAIETKAAKRIEEAKARAKEAQDKVEADLERLAQELAQQADQQIADHAQNVEARKAAALAELDKQLEAALAALGTVNAERVAPLAGEVARLLEQPVDGN